MHRLLAFAITIGAFVVGIAVPATALGAPDVGVRIELPGATMIMETPVVTVGAPMTFSVVARNPGIETASGAQIVLTLPEAFRSAAATPPSGASCAVASLVVTCTVAELAPGAELAIPVTAQSWRSGIVDTTAAVQLAGDTNANNDLRIARISVLRQATGDKCSIIGTPKADVLVGTPEDDRICALGGNDVVRALAGDDRVFGGAGNDRLLGAAGSDWLSGGPGNDTVLGGAGNDGVHGDAGNDVLKGEAGGDTLIGGLGNDSMDGGAELDAYLAGAGNDKLLACDGIGETVTGGPGRDSAALDRLDTLNFEIERRLPCRR